MLISVHRWPNAVRWFGCLLLILLSGCASQVHQFPSALPPAASGIDPRVDAQTRLIESAHRAYAQERYRLASTLFQRSIDANPEISRLSEARWWLAQSYEQGGDLTAALAAYRNVIGEATQSALPEGSYASQALIRLDAIRRSLGPSSLLERRQIALWLTSADWFAVPDVRPWIAQLADAGVTALIVEAGTVPRDTAQSGLVGVYFQTSKVPVVGNMLSVIVPAAHAHGMAVLASLNLHEPDWTPVNPEWGIAMGNRTDLEPQPTISVDVLHPDYQRFVSEVAQDLLRTDIDGLVVAARKTKGFTEEWSPTSRRMFEERFGPSVDIQDQAITPDTWRWAGWKTRSYLERVARLAQDLRQTRSGFLVAVVVHERAVLSPVDALTEYGEDVLEAKQRGLQVVVQPQAGMSEQLDEQGARLDTIRHRVASRAGDEQQLWLSMVVAALDPPALAATVRALPRLKVWHAGTHLLLMKQPTIP